MAAVLAAVREGRIAARVAGVVSNRPGAAGLAVAEEHGVPAIVIDHTRFADRSAFERELEFAIDQLEPDLVVLAGFMRVLDAAFVARYAGRLLNIHPSLLPAYPGLHTHRRALADGVRVHGCTVHFVTHDVDQGPIVAQAAVAVLEDDDEARLAARVLAAEHRILVAAVRWFCEDRLVIEGNRVRVKAQEAGAETLLVPAQS